MYAARVFKGFHFAMVVASRGISRSDGKAWGLHWICAMHMFSHFVPKPRSWRTSSDARTALNAWGAVMSGCWTLCWDVMEVAVVLLQNLNEFLQRLTKIAEFPFISNPVRCLSSFLGTYILLQISPLVLHELGTDRAHQTLDKTDVSRSEQFLKWEPELLRPMIRSKLLMPMRK